MFLDKKTLLKIWPNLGGLNVTIFLGTGPWFKCNKTEVDEHQPVYVEA